jgi:hypothetical protein
MAPVHLDYTIRQKYDSMLSKHYFSPRYGVDPPMVKSLGSAEGDPEAQKPVKEM